MRLLFTLLLLCPFLFSTSSFAQKPDNQGGAPGCGTEEFKKYLIEKGQYPVEPQRGPKPSERGSGQPSSRCGQDVAVPVVFHIMHLGEPVGTGSNIPDAQVIAALQGINDRWSNTIGNGVDLGITFEFARRDPSGNPTTGIDRVNASGVAGYSANGISFQGSPGADDQLIKDLSNWPNDKYYNIWVVHNINGFAAGYAFYPNYGGSNPYDGTIIEMGSTTYGSSALSHELGHAFDLAHTFAGDNNDTNCPPNANCLTDGDEVCDTPPHKQSDCGATNPCSGMGVWDNSRRNYMSYCGGTDRFTAGQKLRTDNAALNSNRRFLLVGWGLIPTGAAKEMGIQKLVFPGAVACAGSFKPIITLKNHAIAPATSIDYEMYLDNVLQGTFTATFNLAAGQTLDIELEQITVPSPGTHNLEIRIVGMNGGGLDTYLIDNQWCQEFDRVNALADLCHDFEAGNFPPTFKNFDPTEIRLTNLTTNCPTQQNRGMIIDGTTTTKGEVSFLLGPLDLTSNPNPILTFDISKGFPYYCSLFTTASVEVSGDCGKSYNSVYFKNDAPAFPCLGILYPATPEPLGTAANPGQTVFFVPDACDDWRREAVDLTSYSGQIVTLLFKFTFNTPTTVDNVVYLDNFCLKNCTPANELTLQPQPKDTIYMCLGGTTTLQMTPNVPLTNTGFIWQRATLSPAGPYTYQTSQSQYSFTGLIAGTYYVRGIAMREGCFDTTLTTVIVQPDLFITPHPQNGTGCLGDVLSLSSNVTGGTPANVFQWQISSAPGGPFTDIPGANALSFTPTTTVGTTYYRLQVTNTDAGCVTVNSNPASLQIDEPILINTDIQDITECVGGSTQLSVLASGGGTIRYTWQNSSSPTGPFNTLGVTTNFITPASGVAGTNYFRVILRSTNGYCRDTSVVATVTVVPDQTITAQPANYSGCAGNPTPLSVTTTGGVLPLNFQWQSSNDLFTWTDVPGANNSTFPPPNTAGTNYYRVIVSSTGAGCPSLPSAFANVTLDEAVVINTDIQDITQCVNANSSLSIGASGGGIIRYQWQTATSPTGPFSNTGFNVNSLMPPSALPGTTYFRVILSSTNAFCKDTSVVAALTTVPNASISTQPQGFTGCLGASVVLNVAASGGVPPLNFQWQSSPNPGGPYSNIPGANMQTFTPPQNAGTTFYQAVVSSTGPGCLNATSSPANVSFSGDISVSTEPQAVTQCVGGTQGLSVAGTGSATIQYQWQSSSSPTGPFTNVGANLPTFSPATSTPGTTYFRVILGSGVGACGDTSAVVASTVVADQSISAQPVGFSGCMGNPISLDVTATGGVTPLQFQWQSAASTGGPWTDVSGATSANFSPPNVAGNQFYRVIVKSTGNGCADAISTSANVNLDAPVALTAEPQDITQCVGGSQMLSVTASGSGTINYQWQSGTSATGPFTNVGGNQNNHAPSGSAGTTFYRVLLSSVSGFCRDTSVTVASTVVPDQTISTQPQNFSGCLGNPISLNAGATGGIAPLNFQWQSASNVAGPWTDVPGANASNFSPPNTAGTVFYRAVVRSAGPGCSDAISATANVTLDGSVSVNAEPQAVTQCVGGTQGLSVAATGSGTINYQWQSSTSPTGPFTNVGTSQNSFSPSTAAPGTNYFRVILSSSNGFCKDTTTEVAFVVLADPAISTQPQNYSGCLGNPISLNVGATGGIAPLNFQWQAAPSMAGPWANVPGANAANFTPPNTAGTVFYRAIVNSAGPGCTDATSNAANVTLDGSVAISAEPQAVTQCVGGTQGLSVAATGSGTINYQWQSSTSPTGPFTNVGTNQNAFSPSTAAPGTNYFRVILSSSNGFCKDTTTVVASIVLADPTISTQPQNYSGCAGDPIQLNGAATGGVAPLNFQWQSAISSNGPWTNVPGATNQTFAPPTTAGSTFYRLVASSTGLGCDAANSTAASVVIDPKVSVSAEPQAVTQCVGGSQTISATATGASASYQWQQSNNQNGPFTNTGTNQNSIAPPTTSAGTTYFRLILNSQNGYCKDTSVVVASTVAADQQITTQPLDYEACVGGNLTLTSAFTGGINPQIQWQSAPASTGPWTNVPGATQATFNPPLVNGGTIFYRMWVSSTGNGCGDAFSNAARVLLHPKVDITAQPQNFTECIGGTTALGITATGGTSLVYQWQISTNGGQNWQNVPGANGLTYVPPSTQNAVNQYRIIVSDVNTACGADTSKAAIVTVRTDFSVRDSVKVCNVQNGPTPVTLDFSTFILVGDPNASWTSLDAPAPPGNWNAKDFTGWTAGNVYRFVATTTNATAPCVNVKDTLFVRILDCCPLVCTDPPAQAICNNGANTLDLNTLECAGITAGSWFLTAGPGVTGQTLVPGGIFNPGGLQAGSYTMTYQATATLPAVCQSSSSEQVQVIRAPAAGDAASPLQICEGENQQITLANQLTGEDTGGSWTEEVPGAAPAGAFSAAAGTLQTTKLTPGQYGFRYKVAGGIGCPDDEALVWVEVSETPIAIAGADQQLTCDSPTVFIGSPLNPSGQNISLHWTETSHNGFVADSTSSIAQIGEPGSYLLTARNDVTGCFSTDLVEVSSSQSYINDVQSDFSDPTCFGLKDGEIEIVGITGGTAPFKYSLNGGLSGTSDKFRNLKAGVYTIRILDANGCFTERTFQLADPPELTLDFTADTTIFCGDSIDLQVLPSIGTAGVAAIQWFENLDKTPFDTTLTFLKNVKPETTTAFKIVAFDQNGCEATASAKIEVNEELPVFAPNIFYPESSNGNDIFKIFGNERVKTVNTFRIFDRGGNLVHEQLDKSLKDNDFGWDGRWRGKKAAPGVYVFYAEIEFCTGKTKFIEGSLTLYR